MLIIVFVIGLIAFIYGLYEALTITLIWLTAEDFELMRPIPESLKGKRILFFSDLQLDLPGGLYNHRMAKKVVDTINAQDVDLVIFGGDFTDASHYKHPYAFEVMKQIKHRQIAVMGNHDYKKRIKGKIRTMYQNTGTLLVNESIDFYGLNIYGIDDYSNDPCMKPDLDESKINLVISHRPDYAKEIEAKFDMMLSGHTHGGQVTLFGKYVLFPHNGYGQELVAGRVKIPGNGTLYVSRGVGGNAFGIPLRFFSKPDMLIIEF